MFTGRRDDQVKLRGQRIELGEVNSTILRNIQIQDCTSIIVGDRDEGQRQQIVSFFVPRRLSSSEGEGDDQQARLIDAIFEDLSTKLPPYMIPSALIPVEMIPMTTVKKIDIKQLTERFYALTADNLQSYSHERLPVTDILSRTEQEIAQIISQATNTPLKQIKVNTSLFSIGLDSISAIYVAKKLRNSGFGQVDVSLILRHSSVGELSKMLARTTDDKIQPIIAKSATKSNGIDGLASKVIQEIKDDFEAAGHRVQLVIPCTALQEAMLSRTVSHGKNAYWNHILFEFYRDIEKLRGAWQQMVERHDILRTCFVATKDAKFSFAQITLEEISLPFSALETTDVDLEISKQKSHFAQRENEEHKVPYGLTIITEAGTGQKMLLFSIHHAIHDGEAMSLLFKEIENVYEGKELLPATQFHQFVDHITAYQGHYDESFWSSYLSGMTRSCLCAQGATSKSDEASQIETTRQGLEISFADFETSCSGLSATPLSVFQASWAQVLSTYLLSSDVCFGTVISGRTTLLDGVENIIGPCFNVLPIRLKVSPTTLNTDVVKIAQEANADILAYQHTSLRHIQKKFSKNGRSLFDSIVLFQRPAAELDCRLWKLMSEEGEMDFPVILEIVPSTALNNISILLHTDSSRVSHEDAQAIMKDFVDTVVHTIKYPLARMPDGKRKDNLPSIAWIAREYMAKDSIHTEASSTLTNGHANLTDEENLVRDVMSELSKYESQAIRYDTTIFQLGLDSINAVQISRMLKDKGYAVSAADILEVRFDIIIRS